MRRNDDISDILFIIFIIWIVAAAVITAFFFVYKASNARCVEEATILSVGGCNKDSLCGVQTDKGPSKARLPVVGQQTCVKWR